MIKVLITGSNGQLGRCLSKNKFINLDNLETIYLRKEEFNLLETEKCVDSIREIKPNWLINCAAYTNVDKAEIESELAIFINGYALKEISEIMKEINCNLIQISTDYVFDGKNHFPYKTNSPRNPLNKYGEGKALGEKIVEQELFPISKSKIIRTSWLMSSEGKNFAKTILELHKCKEEIKVISDQVGSFTSADTLANFIWKIILNEENGIRVPNLLHCTNPGICSWFDIAFAIGEFAEKNKLITKRAKVIPIKAKDLLRKANRPYYSVLDSINSWNVISMEPNYWRKELENIINDLTIEK